MWATVLLMLMEKVGCFLAGETGFGWRQQFSRSREV
jgi:hypothetical protein